MNYINTETLEYPLTERQIKALHPSTSFPKPFKATPYAIVFTTPQPVTTVIQRAKEIAPVLTVKGTWEQQWEIVDAFAEYTDEEGVVHTKEEQEAEALAKELADKTAAYLTLAERTVDSHILAKVKELGYDNENSIAKYMARPTSPWYAECVALGDWIDACWIKCHELLNAGTQLTMDELIVQLPVFGG